MSQSSAADRPLDHGILVLDYGSQYTLLIARRLRELGAYSEVIDSRCKSPPVGLNVNGVILSGGPDSVYEEGSRTLPDWVTTLNVPVLGICYGMQLLVEQSGGKVRGATKENMAAPPCMCVLLRDRHRYYLRPRPRRRLSG